MANTAEPLWATLDEDSLHGILLILSHNSAAEMRPGPERPLDSSPQWARPTHPCNWLGRVPSHCLAGGWGLPSPAKHPGSFRVGQAQAPQTPGQRRKPDGLAQSRPSHFLSHRRGQQRVLPRECDLSSCPASRRPGSPGQKWGHPACLSSSGRGSPRPQAPTQPWAF